MMGECRENQTNHLPQSLTQFNDHLIEKLRLFFNRDTAHPSSITSPSQTCQPPKTQNVTPTKTIVLKPAPLFENPSHLRNPLQKIPQNPNTLLPPFPEITDECGIRKWEDDLCKNNVLNSSSKFNFQFTNQNNDFLSEEFSGKFESDSEFQASKPMQLELSPNPSPVNFLSNRLSAKTVFSGIAFFAFPTLIDKLEARSINFKRYECDQCGRKFYNPAALGGHKSKQHPKSSKRYFERKHTYSLRTGERKKRSFLNNL